jgi:hypothetical protein
MPPKAAYLDGNRERASGIEGGADGVDVVL